jgi:hypothetical protein
MERRAVRNFLFLFASLLLDDNLLVINACGFTQSARESLARFVENKVALVRASS